MRPPTFSKAEDPLEAEAWVKAIEAKFSAFVLPCSEENKANFTALQQRGEALMWCETTRISANGNPTLCTSVIVPGRGYHVQFLSQVVQIHTTRK
jgi:hypothetical protein